MLKIIAVDKKGDILTDVSLERLKEQDIAWYWVDFDTPTRSEINLLTTFFKFHELLIEDCLTLLQRPKIEITRQQIFLVSHVLKNITTWCRIFTITCYAHACIRNSRGIYSYYFKN